MMKLALGTVQFGLDYGVSNSQGQVCPNEVTKILSLAKQAGINTLDTAPAYGDSEQVLGATRLTQQFSIVSKIPALNNNEIDIEHYVKSSLQHLNIKKLSAVLFHQVQDIISSTHAKKRFNALVKLKEQGKITKIGISVYSPAQLEYCFGHYQFDIVQLPLNCFDQRFIQTNWLQKLSDSGIEIHCRSLFLQGLLLMEPEKLPTYFNPFKKHFHRFINIAKQLNISPLCLALAIGHQYNSIEKMVIGCCNIKQLSEIISANAVAKEIKKDLSSLTCENENLIIPSNWHL
ncbi:MAG: aldo/keto reductase [Colwellia sp.]|nr:aldo/keto reductase [Colwellia sp.]